ncbi:anaphase-promoting complex, cyclosome, subunit 4-domain-containing protein [Collybia nuda]|uniref:Anaphase-promoting complex subunit 4 n=1 Tax=Collybia nuda TaxID=64659 RepID=A0A9P5YEA3_9AGAR|nr:anaphase-promoting complex, cyclosome, subunit 4-domain-containing protein [Collybia nuda]
MEESANAFAPLAVLQIPSPSRLLASACCPDKDLVVLISRLGGEDRLSLWNYNHGSKVWEVDAGHTNGTSIAEIVDLAWSPDGQSVAIVHDPPQVTLHSLQDGHKLDTLFIATPPSFRFTGVWWFKEEKAKNTSSIPDIFKRAGTITGTAHSILKILPLLDSLQEDSQKITATDLFAFQGSQTRAIVKSDSPDVIKGWPMLPSNVLAASISPPPHRVPAAPAGTGSEADVEDLNANSILAISDDIGRIHCFLDGSFPLGDVHIGSDIFTVSMFKHPRRPLFFTHPSIVADGGKTTSLRPSMIDFRLLGTRHPRDLAKLSSTTRELVSYILRAVKEMQMSWFGTESSTGAREFGPKWHGALKTKQIKDFGQKDADPVLDLTALLVTGRASDALADLLGSDEQISERGIQKWETTVGEGLIKLRDFSEKRLAPAFQRLYLVMEELQGWAQLPEYSLFEISLEHINKILEDLERAIVISTWLATIARRDLLRFREFISWLRFETSSANTSDNATNHRYDILEVNNYLESGLLGITIDKFFKGPKPLFSKRDLGVPGSDSDSPVSLPKAIQNARSFLNDPSSKGFRFPPPQLPISSLDRNIDILTQELAPQCRRIFDRAANAASRSASISIRKGRNVTPTLPSSNLCIRERTIISSEGDQLTQSLLVTLPPEHQLSLFVFSLQFDNEASETLIKISVALLERAFSTGGEFELAANDFFDDESIVIAYRLRGDNQPTYLATFDYSGLEYITLPLNSRFSVREELVHSVLEQWSQGNLPSSPITIKRHRSLKRFPSDTLSFALNGRAGRRVACILDSKGTTVESFDMEEGEDAEEDSEAT